MGIRRERAGNRKRMGLNYIDCQVSYDGGFGIMMVSRAKHFVKRFVFGALLKLVYKPVSKVIRIFFFSRLIVISTLIKVHVCVNF